MDGRFGALKLTIAIEEHFDGRNQKFGVRPGLLRPRPWYKTLAARGCGLWRESDILFFFGRKGLVCVLLSPFAVACIGLHQSIDALQVLQASNYD